MRLRNNAIYCISFKLSSMSFIGPQHHLLTILGSSTSLNLELVSVTGTLPSKFERHLAFKWFVVWHGMSARSAQSSVSISFYSIELVSMRIETRMYLSSSMLLLSAIKQFYIRWQAHAFKASLSRECLSVLS